MKKYQIVKLHYQFYSVRVWGREIAVASSFAEASKIVKKMTKNKNSR